MELNNLKPAKGSTHTNHRRARGEGSGWGDTAGRGHKGDSSRSGAKEKWNFEGGQTPLQRRLPKKGFKNPFRIAYIGINLDRIQAIVEKFKVAEITPEVLHKNGIISKTDKFKILGRGEINAAVSITAHAVSASAKQAIESKGGSITLV
jgi:large subunit ribosomal protein L15